MFPLFSSPQKQDNVIADYGECRSIYEENSIVYCTQCRRILGYLDEVNKVHFQNVRLFEYTPIGANSEGEKMVSFMKVTEAIRGVKRKFPEDRFDLTSEPSPKRAKLDVMFVMQLGRVINERRLVREDEEGADNFVLSDDDSFFVSVEDTIMPEEGEYFEPFEPEVHVSNHGHTPSGSPTIDNSYDPIVLTPYSPIRYSTPVSISSASSITQHFDVITISSDPSVVNDTIHYPVFTPPVYNTPQYYVSPYGT